uniref:Cilia- and flagella-associated protein 43 n=1 Tax=Trichogramma kaykai TaxID=54128 RepID=A0ABD2XEJ7_9HYME
MNFTTKWIKTGRPYDFVFVSKEVVATASGYYVIFYNLSNGEERIEYFNSQDRGNGVSCLCAHPVISVFSTAERCRNPRLLVHTYPEIRRVASCKLTSNTNAYVSCCFSGSEYLVSLTSIPNYQLVVWLWRTGHKLAQIDSGIADEFQLIQYEIILCHDNSPDKQLIFFRPSPYASHLVYQFSSRLDQLLTFEIYAYSKKATITKNEISLIKNEISCISWTNNNNLLISDVYGNVYIASSDGKKFQMIFCHETRDRKENVILSLNFGYIISENNSQLTCYTKSLGSAKESWKAAWSIKCSSVPVKIALVRHKEAFLVYCENGDVNELCLTNDSKPEMKTLLKNCRKILCLKLLKSDDEFCVCLDELNYLIVFNAIDGYFVTDTKIPFQDQEKDELNFFSELEESEEKAQKRKIANIFQWKCDQINELPFGITWLEEKQLRYEENEKKLYLDLKHKLEHELCELREKVKNILDLNESKNEFCQLTLSDFDILKYRRENLLKKALQNEVENEQRVQEIIKAKEKIIDFIIHSFWEPLRVHDRTILSFSHNTRISNFTIPNDAPPEQLYDSTIELFNTPFNDPVTIIDHENFDGNKEQKHFCSEYSNEDAFSGTTSFKWINNDMSRDQLLEPSLPYVTSDFVNLCENKLKMVFNEKFNLMVQLKSNVLKKNTDLLKIQNDCRAELKRVFGILPESDEFSNVNWKSTEDLDAACAPTEKDATYSYDSNFYCDEDDLTLDDLSNINPLNSVTIEQAKFREEALKRMMDGVLEIRWEDEIKKNIPKPLCLLLKKPSKYDIKDLIAIKTYKNKVDKLQKERQKYRLQLEEKIDSINSRIKADIEMFDKKMEMLAMEKLNVQSAIFQEFLLRFQHVKLSLGHQQNEKLMRTLNDNFESLEKKCKLVATDINHVEQTVIDLRIKFEGLSRRDKAVETKFRTEFADLKQPMVEHLLRQYKRRPNVEKIIYTSLTFLLEANKCLTSGKKSVILPQEYLEFLSFMDSLDVMPNSLPPQIEASHWQSLCKLRRNKVDLEFKLRIASLELSESEHTLLYLQKLHSVIQSKMSSTRNSIETAKSKQLKLLSDNDVQLVLKTAQIEIVTTGETSNYVNATFVFFTKLIEINSAILREGKRKISEMHSLVALKKSIKFQNWKRKCTVKRLNHSKDHFLVLQSTKIQKDMQTYLVERLKKCKKQKDIHQCEKMLKSVEKKFQRMLTEKQKEVTHLVTEINYWQRMNSVLIRDLERSTQLKENKALTLKEDHCRNKNQLFKKSYLSFIMKRNCLSRKLKENHEEITNLQWQLEILKLKTYPTLRFKDVPFSKYHESIRKSF